MGEEGGRGTGSREEEEKGDRRRMGEEDEGEDEGRGGCLARGAHQRLLAPELALRGLLQVDTARQKFTARH